MSKPPLDTDELILRISREVEKAPVALPERERRKDYSRQPVPADMLVPEVY
jgi:hypothetical protein